MNRTTVCLFLVFICITTCKKDKKPDFSLLNGSDFILKIDRISNGPHVQFPRDSLLESYYTVTTEDIQYEVTFSENGDKVIINPGPVSGSRLKNGNESKYYELTEGLFADGRFIVWINNEQFEAEYTVYGSGIPIIKSHRGFLKIKN